MNELQIVETVIKEPNPEAIFLFLLLLAAMSFGSFVITLSFYSLYLKIEGIVKCKR